MRKQSARSAQSDKAKTSKTSLEKAVKKMPTAEQDLLPKTPVEPTLSDIARIQALKPDDTPDRNEPIILSDTWYEYSVFLRTFNVSDNTAKKWMRNVWLPYTQIDRMKYINVTDIRNMMWRFRRCGSPDVP